MKCVKYILLVAMLGVAVVPSEASFHKKWFKKDQGVVVVTPIKVVEPIHVEPIPVEPIHAEPIPVEPIYAKPDPVKVGLLEAKKQHILALWDQMKSTAAHVKTAALYPLKKLIPKKKIVAIPIPVPVPEFKVWPSLGFSHYKKVHYYPVHSSALFTHPVEYIEGHVPEQIPFKYEENVPIHHEVPLIPFNEYGPPQQVDYTLPLYDADHVQSQQSNGFTPFKNENHESYPAIQEVYGPPQKVYGPPQKVYGPPQ